MKISNLKLKILNIKKGILLELNYLRDRMIVHPKVIMLRLRIFKYSPFLSKNFFQIALVVVIIFSFFISFYAFDWRSPRPFPDHALITIERGESLSEIAQSFEDGDVVLSGGWLKFFIILLGGEKKVVAGDYYFPEPKSVFGVARMLHKGSFGLIPLKVTIQEGLSSYEMGALLEKNLPNFSYNDFISEVDRGDFEGYLFPDTYFFMPNTKAGDVILNMRESFAREIKQYEEDILKSGKDIEDIIIMASIVEGEANGSLESKRIVAGILWKRLRLGMPLQVDAPFRYYNGKHSYTLTTEDLKEDHPYNTYVNKGLPPTAISNPGINSIRAAIAPTNTDYLYFMSDKKGNMYYAKDFEGHQRNRERYLR